MTFPTSTSASGIWTLRDALRYKAASQWPRGPVAPTSLAGTGSDGEVALTWVAPATTHGTITDYVVEYTPAAGSPTVVATGSTAASYTLTGLTNGTEYTTRVAAVNHTRGDWSSSVAATPNSAPSDPNFASVSLLLHMDGSNGSTTFTDSSGTPKTVTIGPNGNYVSISTAQSKFGGASAFFSGSGATGNLQAAAGAAPEGTQDFTIEFWHYYNASVNPYGYSQDIVSTSNAYDGSVVTLHLKNNGLSVNGASVLSFANPPDSQWYHAALVREGNTFRFYRDGVQLASGTNSSSLSSTPLYIGSLPFYGASGILNSYIDELRVTRSVARYPGGTTFTPPTAAFPDQ